MARKNMQQRKRHLSEDMVKDLVQKKAYEICQKRGPTPGNEWADWFEAERQVKQDLSIA